VSSSSSFALSFLQEKSVRLIKAAAVKSRLNFFIVFSFGFFVKLDSF